ncbi:MAG: lactate utilization protein B [Bacteroidales bacterium]|jgi:L-lactate dehydrogenase complex protein LldF|nr:lactate utilization protein B [Bacteroidales bacterium]
MKADFIDTFKVDSDKVAFDREHRRKINYNIAKYDEAVIRGKLTYVNLPLAKIRAAHIKYKVVNNLDKYLIDFESKFTSRGGKVIWAKDAHEAIKEILLICKKHYIKSVVKSKSMTTEEIEFNEEVKKSGVESIETDLGEFIVQMAGQKPYHIVTPAMHLSKEDVSMLLSSKFGINAESTPEEVTAFVRELLREKFIHAGAGISGANFLIADTGSVCVTENEGNGLLSMSFPPVHIVIAGIEKIIPSLTDLGLYWPLLASHGTGQTMSVYNSIVSGPRKDGEIDGPLDMYVILLDNGRSRVLADEKARQALSCIRCGACLNACPVYKTIGGHTYNSTYSGPIGSVITPFLKDFADFGHLSAASSLCGKCTEVCPVNIPLHKLLLNNRNIMVKKGLIDKQWTRGIKISKMILKSRKLMNMGGGKFKNSMARYFLKSMWGERRKFPEFQPKTFSQIWEQELKSNQ